MHSSCRRKERPNGQTVGPNDNRIAATCRRDPLVRRSARCDGRSGRSNTIGRQLRSRDRSPCSRSARTAGPAGGWHTSHVAIGPPRACDRVRLPRSTVLKPASLASSNWMQPLGNRRKVRSTGVVGTITAPAASSVRRDDSAGLFSVMCLLFFASGACGLVYQQLWTRQLSLVFGVTVYAVATVLAVFFGGLALGSFLAGRLVSRTGATAVLVRPDRAGDRRPRGRDDGRAPRCRARGTWPWPVCSPTPPRC